LKTYDIKDKVLKKGSWNEVSISSQNTYENSHTYDGISTDNTVKYGVFYYKIFIKKEKNEYRRI